MKRTLTLILLCIAAAQIKSLHALAPPEPDSEEAALYAALHPPKISLSLKNATLEQVADALSSTTGTRLAGVNREPFASNRFTLEAREASFWDTFRALDAQHGLNVWLARTEPFGAALFPQTQHTGKGTESSGFYFYPIDFARTRTTQLTASGQHIEIETWELTYRIRFDPRIRIIAAADPTARKAVDDAGNTLLEAPAADTPWHRPEEFTWEARAILTPPPISPLNNRHGKTVTIKGEARFIVALGDPTSDAPPRYAQARIPFILTDIPLP